MSRREAWLSAGLVFVVAFGIRLWAASQLTFPQPEDTAYYVDAARNLLTGHGLTADSIWSYNTPPLAFPRPAFEVWLPLPTFLDAIPMAIAGTTFAAAQVASILVGSIVAVLAWLLAADVAEDLGLVGERARTLAIGTGLAAAAYLPLVVFSVQPDSTILFSALVLASVLVARRILRRGLGPGATGPGATWPGATGPVGTTGQLVALGALLGLAALTRNDAVWLALVWAIVAWRSTRPAGRWRRRLRAAVPLIGFPAVVAMAVYLPWLLRDWAVFGNPLPGQAALNALFLEGRDVFAWADPPTLGRYLDAGLAALVGLRVTGAAHNVGSVLLGLGLPVSVLGLAGLPWAARVATLRPLVGYALTTFLVATLVFPVATTWGTFLHAAGAIHVLILLSAILVLDRLVERVRLRRAWTRPVAWLGPTFAVVASLLITGVLVPVEATTGRDLQARYAALPDALAQEGVPLPVDGSPVITDFPIWLSTETGAHAIALPNEPPAAVLDLAGQFGATLLVVDAGDEGLWPEILDQGGPGSPCFRPVPLPSAVLDGTLAFEITCSSP